MSKKSKLTDLLPAISLAELRPQLRQAGIDLLSRREHSRDELHSKLTRRFYDRIDSDERVRFELLLNDILDDFTQRGWQSDERFTGSFFAHPISTRAGAITHSAGATPETRSRRHRAHGI
jgi:regulatory protein